MSVAYAVAVRVSLIDGVTSGLMNMSRAFAQTHGHAVALQRQIDAIKFKLLAGGAMTGVGLLGLSLIEKTMPYAKEYSRQLALMNTLGMKQADVARVVGDAWRASYAVPSTTAAQNLATFRELRSAFGSDSEGQAHASAMLPIVGRLQGVMRSLTGRAQDHVGFDMVKAIELRTGVMTTEALKRNSELMSRAIIGMGGTITVQDFHGALKMGRGSTMGWNDDFTYNYLPTLMQELKTSGGSGGGGGAQSAGRVVNAMHSQMLRMTKAAMPLWVEGGLIKPSDVVKNATGGFQVRPGSVKDQALFDRNSFAWVQQDLAPAVAKIVANHKGMTAETAITGMYSNQLAAFGAYNMYAKVAQYERDKTTIGKADGGYAAYNKLLKTDPNLAQAALAAQWQNVLAQIGYSIMPTLVSGTLKLIGALRGLNQLMHEHPTAVKVLTIGFAALSTAMAFGGAVLLLSAGFSGIGLAVSGVSGVAVAFGGVMTTVGAIVAGVALPFIVCVAALTALGVALYEIAKNWDSSKDILDNIKAELGKFFHWLADMIRVVIPGFGVGSKPITPREAVGTRPDGYASHGRRITTHQEAQNTQRGQNRRDPWGHGSPYVAPSNRNSTKTGPGVGQGPGGSPSSGITPATVIKGDVNYNFHAHGVSDPRKFMKDAMASLTGGPQNGSSVFDGSAIMPQVGTRYTA